MTPRRKCLVATIPKSGTHLLQHILDIHKFVSALLFLPAILDQLEINEQAIGHFYPEDELLDYCQDRIKVFLHRDPRDIIVSWAHHSVDLTPITNPYLPFGTGNFDKTDPIMFLIRNLKPYYDGMMRWKSIADYVLEYEKLIDFKNKGYPKLEALCDELGVNRIKALGRAGHKVKRFRTGTKGNWKHEMTTDHKREFERIWGRS